MKTQFTSKTALNRGCFSQAAGPTGIIQELTKEIDELEDEVRRLKDGIVKIANKAAPAGYDSGDSGIYALCQELLK